MNKEDLERTFDNRLWDADCTVEEATGLAQALYDQLNNIINPIAQLDNYNNMTDGQKSLVGYSVVSRKRP